MPEKRKFFFHSETRKKYKNKNEETKEQNFFLDEKIDGVDEWFASTYERSEEFVQPEKIKATEGRLITDKNIKNTFSIIREP